MSPITIIVAVFMFVAILLDRWFILAFAMLGWMYYALQAGYFVTHERILFGLTVGMLGALLAMWRMSVWGKQI